MRERKRTNGSRLLVPQLFLGSQYKYESSMYVVESCLYCTNVVNSVGRPGRYKLTADRDRASERGEQQTNGRNYPGGVSTIARG